MILMDRIRGFTLIELMIVVAVIGVLAAVAYPNYTEYLRKSRRADCKAVMLTYANALERRFSTDNAYPDDLGGFTCPSDGGTTTYALNLNVANGGTSYILTAVPAGTQAGDSCGTLSLSNTGAKAATGTGTCW